MAIDFNKVPGYIRREIVPPEKTVEQGNKNLTVKRIQEWLNFHQCRTGIDSDFGPATTACVKDFQGMKGKSETGKVDASTWKLLVKPMRTALELPVGVEDMTAQQAVLAVSMQHVEQHPVEIGGANCGPWVRLYCEGNDGRQWAWCAGFVSTIMHQAYFYRNTKAPIKGSVSCDVLASQAKAAGLFLSGREITSGRSDWSTFGDACIFLRRRTSTDWTHTGIATTSTGSLRQLVFATIEGNTNDEGVREGFEACSRKRSVASSYYDFIAFE